MSIPATAEVLQELPIAVPKSDNFYALTPDVVLDAIESVGLNPTGLCIQLNSYENRVFDIGLESSRAESFSLATGSAETSAARIVAKFYRPGRWSRQTILDEHKYLFDLKSEGIPVVAPLMNSQKNSLFDCGDILFAVFPKKLGRVPQELNERELAQVGRRLAQIHNIGSRRTADSRLRLDVETFGYSSLQILEDWIWPELRKQYVETAEYLLGELDERLRDVPYLRIHGDCHRGNLLNDGEEFFFVDFDDFCNGPAVQDFWMLVGGEGADLKPGRDSFIDGYLELRDWDEAEWELVPLLRALRLIHYSAWIAKRWSDPSFPRLFPDYNGYLYWLEECDQLTRILRLIE